MSARRALPFVFRLRRGGGGYFGAAMFVFQMSR